MGRGDEFVSFGSSPDVESEGLDVHILGLFGVELIANLLILEEESLDELHLIPGGNALVEIGSFLPPLLVGDVNRHVLPLCDLLAFGAKAV